ncbi:MAG TPA: hypothetical protein VG456_16040 [Candidatus Sulfopaludibacter sp.]|jgi:hypothetical protein|nr:hypothetical protein [Candidatus Sulfopaludibacter sp.]
MSGAEKYRKLPGRRRGIIRGASLWLGEGYLLSVKSMRFREDYKRFYFRDVQAIAVAKAPRFHISTRSLLLGAVWLIAYGVASVVHSRHTWILWTVAAALVAAWVVVSGFFSCRCRLYTAVSREELPSVYRTWTARKFLDKLTPHITEVQGAAPDNWAELAQDAEPVQAARFAAPTDEAALHPNAREYTLTALLLVGTLWCGGAADLLLLRATSTMATQEQIWLALALIIESILLFVEYHRGKLRKPMRNLAIASMIAVGGMYYVKQMTYGFFAGAQQQAKDLKIPFFYSGTALTRGMDAAVCIILGLVGLGIIFLRRDRQDQSGMNL